MADPVLIEPLFHGGLIYFPANQKLNAGLKIGLEYEP